MDKNYKECGACTLPYIEGVNGREGYCDFCGGTGPTVAIQSAGAPSTELFCLSTAEPKLSVFDRL